MPKPAAAICWKVAPLIHRDSAFCSFSRAWSCAGRDERSPNRAALITLAEDLEQQLRARQTTSRPPSGAAGNPWIKVGLKSCRGRPFGLQDEPE
jgi:hypothetical protein